MHNNENLQKSHEYHDACERRKYFLNLNLFSVTCNHAVDWFKEQLCRGKKKILMNMVIRSY